MMPTNAASAMTDDSRDMEWAEFHPGLILMICGCWWCDQTGDLRALSICSRHARRVRKSHMRDVKVGEPRAVWFAPADPVDVVKPREDRKAVAERAKEVKR